MDYFDSDNDGLELLLNSSPPKGGKDDVLVVEFIYKCVKSGILK